MTVNELQADAYDLATDLSAILSGAAPNNPTAIRSLYVKALNLAGMGLCEWHGETSEHEPCACKPARETYLSAAERNPGLRL